jgi:hypothetical protein
VNEQLRIQALQDAVRAINGLRQALAGAIPNVISVAVGPLSGLPGSPVEGMLAGVTDSTTNTWGATITGGGSNHVLAYYDGTNWTVAGK